MKTIIKKNHLQDALDYEALNLSELQREIKLSYKTLHDIFHQKRNGSSKSQRKILDGLNKLAKKRVYSFKEIFEKSDSNPFSTKSVNKGEL